jgi:hypothetical protein
MTGFAASNFATDANCDPTGVSMRVLIITFD